MEYEEILKHAIQTPMGIVIPFEGMLKLNAISKGITYEEELKTFNAYKDEQNNIKDVEFVTDQYEEIN